MVHEVLTPGMENADHPDPGAEMFWVMGEFQERLRYGSEKKIVQDLPIHRYQGVQFGREGEDHVEIRNG